MELLSLENSVFTVYVIAASLMVLKVMGQGWMTVHRMLKVGGGWASPEDLRIGLVIPPFLMGSSRRIQAAVFSFIAGVIPPMPMLGRSLL